jgi:pyruvate kinase
VPVTSPEISGLLAELKDLRESCLEMERDFAASVAEANPESQRSVRNLLHYLALRSHDLRDLQSRLAALGLSSLGRTESNVLAGIDAVISILEHIAGVRAMPLSLSGEESSFRMGSPLLARHAEGLLGAAPKGRNVRIMVTMPSEAADSYEVVRGLVDAGMDVMRVNCAHDSEHEWERMIAHMQRANQECGRSCRVLMDLAGPKLRTGTIHRGYHVVRWRVEKDPRGFVAAPARIVLAGKSAHEEKVPLCDARLPAPETLLREAKTGDTIRITDSRGKSRTLSVILNEDHVCLCTCDRGGYVLSHAALSLRRAGKEIDKSHIGALPFVEQPLRLRPRDLLILTKEDNKPLTGEAVSYRDRPHISCTLPEVFATAQPGQPIFFDDGKIEGRIRETHPDHIVVDIVHTGGRDAKLGSAKGINLPETELGIPAMTEKDRRDLDFVAVHADIVGMSFACSPEDVLDLQQELTARGKAGMGIILKIENRRGFEHLPLIMLAALKWYPVGIMVARGDLAIEVGFERLAEVQEEILWLSEAAQMPVVWATQVLETLAKTGMPSRAEVTDAAMGVRAECVMLNKGEHIVEAVRFLDHILHRMKAHHLKKRSMLRRLAVARAVQAPESTGNAEKLAEPQPA